jgi:spore germination protein YaaH
MVAVGTAVNQNQIFMRVLPKETKYSIAKQYGITIEELEKKNPEVVANLPVGYKLLIRAPKVASGIIQGQPSKQVSKL